MSKKARLQLSGDPVADRLLSDDPLALLIGMVLDQQIRLELAFAAPHVLSQRLGRPLDAADLAAMDPDELAEIFRTPPSLHRYWGSMAGRVQELCRRICDDYGGDAARVWKGVKTGDELVARIKALPGFGEQKARIFAALLGKQLGVRPAGWEAATEPFGEPGSHRSVADIVDPASRDQVRQFKQAMKAEAKARASAAGAPAPARRGRARTGATR